MQARVRVVMPSILPADFYRQDTIDVARSLLGKVLVRRLPDGSRLSGRIVETEAYLGVEDPACHTFGGRKTERVRPMYLAGGHAYVYLIYGLHNCFNVVTMNHGEPEAVLIRALEPLEGIKKMERLRRGKLGLHLASGPGKLCQAMQIDRSLSGHNLGEQPLWIEDSAATSAFNIDETSRVGIDYAGDAAHWPLRFLLK